MFLLFIRFNENIVTDPGHVDIFPASRIPSKLHHLVKPIYRNSSGAFTKSMQQSINKEKGFRFVTEPNNLCSILQWASCDEVKSSTLCWSCIKHWFAVSIYRYWFYLDRCNQKCTSPHREKMLIRCSDM